MWEDVQGGGCACGRVCKKENEVHAQTTEKSYTQKHAQTPDK